MQNEFEKWRATRVIVGGVGGVLEWVACQREWRGWRACVGGVGGVLTWVACYYYCHCYY